MKTTQAWAWLAVGVVALGLNGIYHDGGAVWVNRLADRIAFAIASPSDTLADLASERADRLVEKADLMTARDEAASCRLAAAMARFQSEVVRAQVATSVLTPDVVRVMKVSACPRVRVSVPRAPVVRIPAPVVHVEVSGNGPV